MFDPCYEQQSAHVHISITSATVVAALISNGNASVTSIDDLRGPNFI